MDPQVRSLQQHLLVERIVPLTLENLEDFKLGKCYPGIRGAMVARLTPDQKVACSIHVGFNSLTGSISFHSLKPSLNHHRPFPFRDD
ncbi:unnamed protein product [Dovyalis caffra]|uniref:Uncharacterized protein n=1 Tax=Dovyalis caffra TaxID=77055 RepID=A0AAV1SII2_9ROSI|nr:unnamed protein product [Dovyalis caffra]